jgi:hypothetical protein
MGRVQGFEALAAQVEAQIREVEPCRCRETAAQAGDPVADASAQRVEDGCMEEQRHGDQRRCQRQIDAPDRGRPGLAPSRTATAQPAA